MKCTLMFSVTLLALHATAAVATCHSDSDCPSSYCQNPASGHGSCHECGDNCCSSDADCKGSYCVNDPTKMPPYFCHVTSPAALETFLTPIKKQETFLNLNAQSAKPTAPTAPAPNPNPLSPAAAADEKAVKAFLEKYQQVVAGVAIGVGFIFAFGGYRFFNSTLFLCAAAAAGFVSFTLIQYYQPNTETSKPAVVLGVTLTLAVFAGVLAVYVRKLGTFLAGAAGGASLAFMVNAAVLNKLTAPAQVPGLYLYLAILILGMLGGMMALKIERLVIILSTSLAGSLACVAGVGKFLGHFPTSVNSFVNPNTHAVTHSAWVWAYAGVFILMVVVSTLVQFRTTGDRTEAKKEEKYKNSLLYAAPVGSTRPVYVDHVSGYNTSV